MIGLAQKYLDLIITIVERELTGTKSSLYLFGSRAGGNPRQSSDVDLALQSENISPYNLSHLREAFEESSIPYRIDLIDLNTAGEKLKSEIAKKGVLLWKS